MKIPKKQISIGGEVFEVPDLSWIFRWGKFGIFLVIVGLWLLTGFYIVSPDQVGVIRRFGKYNRQTTPGIAWRIPFPIEHLDRPRIKQVKRAEIGFRTINQGPPARYSDRPNESLMLTGNLNIVDCDLIVQYRIADPVKYLFKVRDIDITLHAATEAALRQVIGKHDIDQVLTTGKGQIQEDTMVQLQEILDRYDSGLLVVAVQLQDVHPPEAVNDAFKDVASAKEDQARMINQAEGYRNDLIPRTRGEAAQVVKEAEAWAGARIARADGEAKNFIRVLGEYHKAKEVTRKRMFLETMKQILPGVKKYILKGDKDTGLMNILGLPGPGSMTTGGKR